MTDTPEPEPDVPTQLKEIGKKYLRFISLELDSVIKDITPRPKRPTQAKKPKQIVAEPKPLAKPKRRNLGIRRWLRGPEEDSERS